MGASNFCKTNTSKVFAVLMDTEETFKECSECGHKHYDYECSLNTLNECENGCEGASLDFVVEFNGEENKELDFYWDFDNSDMNRGLQVLQNRNAVKWAEKKATELKELIEEVFTKVSMPLNVVASFSNGETIYQKA